MSVHRSGSWYEQSRMGTFLRTGPRFHETSSSIISDRSKLVDRFAGSWHYLTPLPSLSLSLSVRAQRDLDFRVFEEPPRLVEIRDRFARGTRDALVPVSFYLLSSERIYRLPIKCLGLMGHR